MTTNWNNQIAVRFPDGSLSVQPLSVSEEEAFLRARRERDSWNRQAGIVQKNWAAVVRVTLAIAETEIE